MENVNVNVNMNRNIKVLGADPSKKESKPLSSAQRDKVKKKLGKIGKEVLLKNRTFKTLCKSVMGKDIIFKSTRDGIRVSSKIGTFNVIVSVDIPTPTPIKKRKK